MKCEFGYCMICEKEIAKPCPTCSTKTKTGDYTEVQIEWSNGSKMQIAVCLSCATSHAWKQEEAKKGITQAHFGAWEKMGHTFDRGVVVV